MGDRLKGFGTQNLGFGDKPVNECLKQVGDGRLGGKGIRPVGGSKGGESGNTPPAKGPAKMDSPKGTGISMNGKGPALMPKGNGSTEMKNVGGTSTSKLGGKGVRTQP